MKLVGLVRIAGQLVSPDSNVRSKARYLLSAKLRGIDLNGATVEQLGLDPTRSHFYADSGPELEQALQSFDISPEDVALDLGCGKGGAMITLARHFSRVDGVEISAPLVEIARDNLKRAHASHSEVYCADATEFKDLDRYTVVYIYNPFPAPVVAQALANLRESWQRKPRNLRLIYRNPTCDDIVAAAGFRRVANLNDTTQPIYFYVYDGPPS